MTTVFQGHVTRTELGNDNKLNVNVQTDQAACGQEVILRIPIADASHWLPGRTVSFTAYAFEPAKPVAAPLRSGLTASQKEAENEESRKIVSEAYADGYGY